MAYRSMAKTSPDKIKDYDDMNPENKQAQSILSPAFDNLKWNREKRKMHQK